MLRKIIWLALLICSLGGCSTPSFNHVFPGGYPPVFSPSNAGQPCNTTPYTFECQNRPDVIDPNQ